MLLLLAFALVAGIGTAFSPCVLPVLPVALSAGATGGRRRPLGVATGLALSHTFALVLLVYLLAALGLPDDLFRTLAIVVLLGFGVSLAVPVVAAHMEGVLSRLARRPRAPSGDGFWSGMALGAGLGLVYAPCAGPILAGVVTVSAAQGFTTGRLAVALAYGIGSAIGVYAIMLGGRRLARRVSRRSMRLQQALGAVMVVMAVLLFADVDTRFQTAVANDLPAFLVNPTERLEEAVGDEAAAVRGGRVAASGGLEEAAAGRPLPVLGVAPDVIAGGRWFNSRPLSLPRDLRGKVVLLDFWTYTCINCIRTFPHLRAWDRAYRDDGLVIIGVHTPEFAFEKDAENVRDAIEQSDLRYPVVQDNDFATWDAYGNRFWPAKYLVDAEGHIRFVHFGEGDYEETELAIRSLLAEAGRERLGATTDAEADTATPGLTTPETYLGAERAQGFVTPVEEGTRTYPAPRALPPDSFALSGNWTVDHESATAGPGAAVSARFRAKRVFLVLDGGGRSRAVRVLLDGRPIPDRLAGEDVRNGVARVRGQRLYRLVDLPAVGSHELRLEFEPGVSGFAFTFG